MAQEFKLKGLTSLDLKDGQKQEVEVEGIEDGKVLLVHSLGKVRAVSSRCTHYGAPLIKGVLSPGGRITCPWHGACFNVGTGDVEDAPALDPLATFEVLERDGAVYIKGDKDGIVNSGRTLNIKCTSEGSQKVVVIGGGSGAVGVIEGLRGGGFKGEIVSITKEGHQPIDRTKLSKTLMTDMSKLAWRTTDYYKDAGIDIIHDEVSAVDFAKKSVSTKSGKSHTYTKLVIASGGTPRWLPLEGLKGDLKNVHLLRTIGDAQGILDSAGDNGKKIVVVGSSFIGMEVANCLAGKKNDVIVVGQESEPMERVMGTKVGKIFRGLLEKKGVKFYMSAAVEKATPSSEDSSKVGAVHLGDGTKLDVDLVVEGVGVAPATEFLEGSPEIELQKDGSLLVDESFAVRGLSDVFAIGDIASYPYHGPGGNGQPVRIEHWNVAQNAGRSVAHVINKPGEKPRPFIPIFWSALGSQLRYCGSTASQDYDDVILNGEANPEKPSWVAYYCKGETVLAVASMMKDPYVSKCAELMRNGYMPTKSEISGGKDPMEVQIPVAVSAISEVALR
jgi:NADPH-dependent 2,4-dienoyl-CoA reductase/sulfur reductase-like enzyme/nitrite reductase/ring-hydroxylating ferredoxin subunit